MNLTRLVEIWDGILFFLINVVGKCLYCIEYIKNRKVLSQNKALRNKHLGQRCFIVLNGPSINYYDLSPLRNEIVFASNYFFRAPLCNVVAPNYYCWLDAKLFLSDAGQETIYELTNKCPDAHFLFNYKSVNSIEKKDNISFVYSKHIPNKFGIKNDLSGLSSNFSTVAFFAIASAIYMGFKEIYVLGLDFEPGGFKHFTNLGKGTECLRPGEKVLKTEVCGLHWGYVKAQYESYYIADLAKNNKCRIINLNPNSCIRAFEFGNYQDIFK